MDLEVVAEVGPTAPPSAAAPPAAEEFLEHAPHATAASASAEYLAEDIERVVEPASASAASALGESGVPVAVVGGAFFVVAQDVVGLAEFLEFFLRRRVVRVFVGVELDGELAVGLFDFGARRPAPDLQHLVVVSFFSHGSNRRNG